MDSHRAALVINIIQLVLLTSLIGYFAALHLEGAKTLRTLVNSTQDIEVTLGTLVNKTQDIEMTLAIGFLRQVSLLQNVLSNMTHVAEKMSYNVAISLMKKLVEPGDY